MFNLIDKINEFEAGSETVESFNEIFSNCKLEGFYFDEIVTIGDCCSPETSRMLKIGDCEIRHNFVPVFSEIVVEVENEH